jgi:hypothetical protein
VIKNCEYMIYFCKVSPCIRSVCFILNLKRLQNTKYQIPGVFLLFESIDNVMWNLVNLLSLVINVETLGRCIVVDCTSVAKRDGYYVGTHSVCPIHFEHEGSDIHCNHYRSML